MKLSKTQIVKTLAKAEDRFMMLTHREGYAMDDGRTVDRRIGDQLSGLFSELPVQVKGKVAIVPNNDGLFEGHSQTWRAVK